MSQAKRAAAREVDDSLEALLQELVDGIPLKDGAIQVGAHNGQLSFARVMPSFRIALADRLGASASAKDFVVQLVGVADFIEERLRPHVLPKLGPFGCMEIVVKKSVVDSWEFRQKHKRSRSRKNSRPPK
jgi:hypothetical protein